MSISIPLLPGLSLEPQGQAMMQLLVAVVLPFGLGWLARSLLNPKEDDSAPRLWELPHPSGGRADSQSRMASEPQPTRYPEGSKTPTQPPGTPCQIEYPHCVGAFIEGNGPAKGLWQQGGTKAWEHETDYTKGCLHFLHRRSDDSAVDRSGNYPYSEVFEAKRCFWEARVQFKFKKIPQGKFYFGIQLDEYVPTGAATKYAMGLVVQALKLIAGDIYHSVGDDPKVVTTGEREKPVFVMPMWAFDQVIITPPGEEAPDITVADISHLGVCRATNKAEFMQVMRNFQPELGYTYTCNLWAISKLLDLVMWRIAGGLPFPINMNNFAGRAPVHVVLYALKDDEDGETRHLASRIQSYFHLAVWSTLEQPPAWRLKELVADGAELANEGQRTPLDSAVARNQLRARNPTPTCCSCFSGICG